VIEHSVGWEHPLILLGFLAAVTAPLLIADGLLNYAAYRGKISYWAFVVTVGLLFLVLLLFLGLCSWFLGSDGWNASEFAMNVVVYPGLIWLFIVALTLGTISLVSGGSPRAYFLMLDEQARIRRADSELGRSNAVVGVDSGAESRPDLPA